MHAENENISLTVPLLSSWVAKSWLLLNTCFIKDHHVFVSFLKNYISHGQPIRSNEKWFDMLSAWTSSVEREHRVQDQTWLFNLEQKCSFRTGDWIQPCMSGNWKGKKKNMWEVIFGSKTAKQSTACYWKRKSLYFFCVQLVEDAYCHSITRLCITNTKKLRKWRVLNMAPLHFVAQRVSFLPYKVW